MVRDTISELGAPIDFVETPLGHPVLYTPKNTKQADIEAAARKERDELEAVLRGELENNHKHQAIRETTRELTKEELDAKIKAAIHKWDGMDESKKVFDAYAEQERKWKEPLEQAKQSDLEAAVRKERDELEATLRKEQQTKDIATYGKELQTVLDSCGIHTTFTESEYEGVYTSKNRYEKLVELIQPATKLKSEYLKKLKSEYLNCSEYYYNADRDTIFEITTMNPNETLTIVDTKVDVTLRSLNGLPLVVTS